ncbi:MAG TPA: 1-deoxy-D-xylulose-5-phosphate reductoisomerase [Pseudomonas xinjiangensis]|uniref:1-deoxy-D-xylulose 5-phosphate reductoisomerase n=2 Tax=root TaxID=1 RepID=A0A7V1BNQ2_9GAMM|nr:1-deoxy-D-xylulose-5-phosphate reductoisomerase [Halopseudomonas xinjiangensis]HEC46614.1 1-deoxy-D-xylulose-5-phosphate reductoisomerase [Halopseudomonas xinjiangensis]
MKLSRISVLGATGSIGLSTLDVIARHPDRYCAFALTGHSRMDVLAELCLAHRPVYAVVAEQTQAHLLEAKLSAAGLSTQVLHGPEALAWVAAHEQTDAVMAAIVGAAGLYSTMAAVQAGKKVLLANKESLVMAGALLMEAAKKSGAQLLPIDSEHNAIFQCMPGDYAQGLSRVGVRRILLTASGGPFRRFSAEELKSVTPEQACAHPNWSMGQKISVDSASMMNKGLELIEACWLFGARPDQVEIVVHPQSVVHSLVDYVDGSVLAQLGNPDMRTPIAHALAWPERVESGVGALELLAIGRLDFEAPDPILFPCLGLARAAAEAGGTACAILNAANEVAVEAFLNRRVGFTAIPVIIEHALAVQAAEQVGDLEQVMQADKLARRNAAAWLANKS